MVTRAAGIFVMLKMMSRQENARNSTTMAGTTRSATEAMRLMPPMMTRPASTAVTRPPMTTAME